MKIVLVNTEELTYILKTYFQFHDYEVLTDYDYKTVFGVLKDTDVVIIDCPFKGEEGCMNLALKIQKLYPSSPKVIIMTTNMYIESVYPDFKNFLIKPFRIEDLDLMLSIL